MLNEIFNVEWKLWTENKEYGIYSRMSDRGLICLQTTGTVDCDLDEMTHVMNDFENRAKWDANFLEGGRVLKLNDDTEIHYCRTRRVAVVSSRDAYSAVKKVTRDASSGLVVRQLRTKGKVLRSNIIACKSIELGDDYTPSVSGIVRIIAYLTGYYI